MKAYAISSNEIVDETVDEIVWGRYGLEEIFPYLKRVPEKDKMMEVGDGEI